MIRIDFQQPNDSDWRVWRNECSTRQEEHNAAFASGLRPAARKDVYARLKKIIYMSTAGPFAGKCAFCESRIVTNQHGDIDHYRPKAAVRNENGQPVRLTHNGEPHPGYYWLAYDWKNLLPVCISCNRPNKRDRFPLAEERLRAQNPGDEVREEPLLIHPLLDQPEAYLGIDRETGLLFALNRSPKADATIRILALNERSLPAARLKAYNHASTLMKAYLHALRSGSPEATKHREHLLEIRYGRAEYSIAARLAIRDILEQDHQIFVEVAGEFGDSPYGGHAPPRPPVAR